MESVDILSAESSNLLSRKEQSMGTRGLFALLFFVAATASAVQAAPEGRLMRYPDIDGSKIVFTYGGDLWTVPSGGGLATRLTTHPGYEGLAKFSPDGTQIAFTGYYDGNSDVFVMPSEGGVPVRLTFDPSQDIVVDWHPSGKEVLFRSNMQSKTNPGPRYNRLYLIDSKGGFPNALPLFEGGLTSFSPDGKKIAYNRMETESRTWKRYQGGMQQDIWLYDLEKNKSERLTDYMGFDGFPMWYRNSIYFISDREHTMNIFCLDLDTRKLRKVTNHSEFDVKWPSLGGDAIVYENGGYLYVLDLKTEKTKKIDVEIPSDLVLARPSFKKVGGSIADFGISRTGKRAVLGARGEIFTVPAEKGDWRNITKTQGVRERAPAWSPDGKWIAYVSDESGEYEIYLRDPEGKDDEVRVTHGYKGWPWGLLWSPDSKKIAFSDQTYTLYFIDTDKKDLKKVDKNENGDIYNFSWSPDSKWIAYHKVGANHFGSIYLYSLENNKINQVTSGFYDDYNPVFDPDGKYLYFFSNRSWFPQFSRFEDNFTYVLASDICVATLQADTPSPLAPESDEEEVVKPEEKKDESAAKEEQKAGEKEEAKKEKKKGASTVSAKDAEKEKGKEGEAEKPKDIKIDFEGFEHRIVSLPVEPANYFGLSAASGSIYYLQLPEIPVMGEERDENLPGRLMTFDMKKREAKEVISGIEGYDLSADGKKILYRAKQNFGIIDAGPGKKVGDGKIETGTLEVKVDPEAEWGQMYNEAWRLERDFFYDPNMHGVDWPAMKARYAPLVKHVGHREDLNYIIGELISELNTSHTYIGGGDMPMTSRINVGLLGCDYTVDTASGRYRIAKIFTGRNWDKQCRAPLTEPGISVAEGDYLIAVNGADLKYPATPYSLMENTADEQVVIKIAKDPNGKDAKDVTVVPVGSEYWLRYNDWVESNRRKVDEATGGKVGYIHVPNTSIVGLNEFVRSFYPQFNKEGLIIDVRYNSGGMVPDIFIERLSRDVLSLWARREGTSWITPATAPLGRMVCLINGYAGSGGDAFPYYFRERGLGPLIGTTTWGGLVGFSRGIQLMDGGFISMPDFGFYNLKGEWDVERVGVKPDIEIDNVPDEVVKGRDPQLEKGIEVIMKEIEENPRRLPEKPTYPIKK
jgi:tricorn protease